MELLPIDSIIEAIFWGLMTILPPAIIYDMGKGENPKKVLRGGILLITWVFIINLINYLFNFINHHLAILITMLFLIGAIVILKTRLSSTVKIQIYYYLIKNAHNTILQRLPDRMLPQTKKEAYKMMILSFPTMFREYLEELYEKIPDEKLKKEIEKVEKIEKMPMGKHIPLVVNAKHLSEEDILPHFAFASPLIRTPLEINKKRRQGKIWNELNVEIDKRQLDVGIYNTAGKLFLKHYYFNMKKNDPKRVFETSKEIMDFLKQDNPTGSLVTTSPNIFRWVSGGALPIVKWKGKYWIVTFFRHIEPVGLNIPIGSSESKNEYLSVYGIENLILREFSEEVIVLNKKPQPTRTVNQKKMILRRGVANKVIPKKFIEKHRDLRRDQDSIAITDANEELIVTPITSNSEITLKKIDEKEEEKLEGVLFIINPLEFGIEIIQPVYFEMDNNDYIIDGEIWEVDRALVRQPVVLISYDYLCRLYNENGSLGKYIDDINDNSRDGKRLERIPADEYYVFAADVELKERRLRILRARSNNANQNEINFLNNWLNERGYGAIFRKIGDKWGNEKPDLDTTQCDEYIHGTNLTEEACKEALTEILTLCPATWKAIELLCENGIDTEYIKKKYGQD